MLIGQYALIVATREEKEVIIGLKAFPSDRHYAFDTESKV